MCFSLGASVFQLQAVLLGAKCTYRQYFNCIIRCTSRFVRAKLFNLLQILSYAEAYVDKTLVFYYQLFFPRSMRPDVF